MKLQELIDQIDDCKATQALPQYLTEYSGNWITIYGITIDDDKVEVNSTGFEDLEHLDEQTTEDIMTAASVYISETLAKCDDIDLVIYDGYNQVSGRYDFRVEMRIKEK